MKVLVTGGAGYVGSILCQLLVEQDHKVRVLDACIYGKKSLDNVNVDLQIGDARHVEDIVRAMSGIEAVIHLAGFVGDPVCSFDPSFTAGQNFFSTQLVANVAKYYEVPRFVFASSCSVYGQSEEKVDENSECNPIGLYATDKLYTEGELIKMQTDKFKVGILRLSTLFGIAPRPRFDLAINIMTAKAVTGGEFTVYGGQQWRPFLHVRDAARAFMMMLNTDETGPFNVGSEALNSTMYDAGKLIELYTKAKMFVADNQIDTRSYNVCFDRIKKLGFKPTRTIHDGIRELIESLTDGTVDNYMNPAYSNSQYMRNLIME